MKLTRKIYLSLFTTMFILVTCVATTFAWVGMFTSSSLGSFDLNLKSIKKTDYDYSLLISPTGDVDSFDESVNLIDIQTQIMDNIGGIVYASESEKSEYSSFNTYSDYINFTFSRNATLLPVTPGYDSNSNFKVDLSNFYQFENLKYGTRKLQPSTKYFKFDLFLTVDAPSGITSTTSINANVFFDSIAEALSITTCEGDLIVQNPFSTLPSTDPFYGVLSNINGTVKLNSMSATRLAFEIYNPIDYNRAYETTAIPHSTIIYQGGSQTPSYDSSSGIYSFGGILPEKYNLAIKELNKMFDASLDIYNVDDNNDYLYESAIYRYENSIDKEMVPANNVIWSAPNDADVDVTNINFLGAEGGLRTKMKITCYFWFEGWDADCIRFIDKNSVSINLVFTTDFK